METSKKTVSSIAHLGYVVDCLEDNIAAFAPLYGIDRFEIYDFKPLRAWAYGKEIFDCRFRIAMGAVENGISMELIQPISGSTPQMEFLKRCGGGVHHFSVSVRDFEGQRSQCRCIPNANIIFEAEVYDEKRGYRRCFYVQIDKACPVVEFAEIPRKYPPDPIQKSIMV